MKLSDLGWDTVITGATFRGADYAGKHQMGTVDSPYLIYFKIVCVFNDSKAYNKWRKHE
jgi:hypothetical protein